MTIEPGRLASRFAGAIAALVVLAAAASAALPRTAKFVGDGVITVAIVPFAPPIATYATDAQTVVGADADIASLVAGRWLTAAIARCVAVGVRFCGGSGNHCLKPGLCRTAIPDVRSSNANFPTEGVRT